MTGLLKDVKVSMYLPQIDTSPLIDPTETARLYISPNRSIRTSSKRLTLAIQTTGGHDGTISTGVYLDARYRRSKFERSDRTKLNALDPEACLYD
jgi:hypothetical protein